MIVHLIRHLPSVANEAGVYAGHMDVALSEDVKLLGDYPTGQAYYTSPLKRCKDTYQKIYGDRPVVELPAFMEMNFGHWEGKSYQELSGDLDYQRWLAAPYTAKIPGGEDYQQFTHRILDQLNKLLEMEFEEVVIVTHGGVIAGILHSLLIEDKEFYEYIPKNGSVTSLIFEEKKITQVKRRRFHDN